MDKKQADNPKRGKSVGRSVYLPRCVACGAYAVADNVGVCLKCGEKSMDGRLLDRILKLEDTVKALREELDSVSRQADYAYSQTARIGPCR